MVPGERYHETIDVKTRLTRAKLKDIKACVAAGMSNKEIAKVLGMSQGSWYALRKKASATHKQKMYREFYDVLMLRRTEGRMRRLELIEELGAKEQKKVEVVIREEPTGRFDENDNMIWEIVSRTRKITTIPKDWRAVARAEEMQNPDLYKAGRGKEEEEETEEVNVTFEIIDNPDQQTILDQIDLDTSEEERLLEEETERTQRLLEGGFIEEEEFPDIEDDSESPENPDEGSDPPSEP